MTDATTDAIMLQFPSPSPLALNKLIRVASISHGELRRIPLQLFPGAIRGVAQKHRLGQSAAIIKVAESGSALLACIDPLGMMADRFGNRRLRGDKIFELILREKRPFIVIRRQHPLFADKERAVAPLGGKARFGQDGGMFVAVVPGEMNRGLRAA